MKRILVLLPAIMLFACDQKVGENGVVQDAATGQRLEDVKIYLKSHAGHKTEMTDSTGYFNTILNFSCGLSNCSDDYTLTFEKEGYQTMSTDERYYFQPTTEFVTPGTKDTLIFKMTLLNGN